MRLEDGAGRGRASGPVRGSDDVRLRSGTCEVMFVAWGGGPTETTLGRWSGVIAATGGASFSSFWASAFLDVPVPASLLSAWRFTAVFLLILGAVGIQIRHDSVAGRIALLLIIAGFMGLLELIVLGFILFGFSVVLSDSEERWGGASLTVGACLLALTAAISGEALDLSAWKPYPLATLSLLTALVLIGTGWVLIGLSTWRES
jgi:hypothetical protein